MAEERRRLMTAKEAARYLRVSQFTLDKIERGWIGALPHSRGAPQVQRQDVEPIPQQYPSLILQQKHEFEPHNFSSH